VRGMCECVTCLGQFLPLAFACVFSLKEAAPAAAYPLSLHDALPISAATIVATAATAAVAAAGLCVVVGGLVVCGGPVASAVTTLTSRHQTVLPLAVSAVVLII